MECSIHPLIDESIKRLNVLMESERDNSVKITHVLEQVKTMQRRTQILSKQQPKFIPSLRKYELYLEQWSDTKQ